MALSPALANKIKEETDALRKTLQDAGLYAHPCTEEDVEPAFARWYCSLPDVMTRWHNNDPTAIILVHVGDEDATLCHFHVVDLLPEDKPLLFVLQDYEDRIMATMEDKQPLPRSVILMGFMGECVRGTTLGNNTATRYLSEFLRFMFPEKNRFYLQLGLGKDVPMTVTIDGYFTDA